MFPCRIIDIVGSTSWRPGGTLFAAPAGQATPQEALPIHGHRPIGLLARRSGHDHGKGIPGLVNVHKKKRVINDD